MHPTKIDELRGLAVFEPARPLEKKGFELAVRTIDPYIEKFGLINGLIAHVEYFPGWDSIGALASHLKFVKEHHKKISGADLSTDSVVMKFSEPIGSCFLDAEIKIFPFQELELAKEWVSGSD
jgi:hypothetical protein